jgi:hypothetical protein
VIESKRDRSKQGEEEEERGDEPNMCEKDDCIYPAEIATGQV